MDHTSFIDSMVDRIETQSLSQYYDIAYLGFIESALARTVLASLLRSEDLVQLGLKWIAFDPSVLTESVWYMAFDPKRIELEGWEPEPFYPPALLVEHIRQAAANGSPQKVGCNSLPADVATWDELKDVAELYIFETGDRKRLGNFSGQIVLAVPDVFLQSKVTRAVQEVSKQLRDRARVVSAANPTTLRLIHQLDHRYQEKIIRAIEGRPLNRLLDQEPFRRTSTVESTDEMSRAVGYTPPHRQSPPEDRFKANLSGYRGRFMKAVNEKAEKTGDAVRRTDQGVKSEKQLITEYGKFHGWAMFKQGGQAFLLVTNNLEGFFEVLVDFVQLGAYRRDNITLFVICDEADRDHILLIAKPWKKLFESAGTTLDVQILKDL